MQLTRQLKPDILLLYPRLPKVSGLEALRELNTPAIATPARVIMLEVSGISGEIVEALQLGARGVVTIDSLIQEWLKAIQTVMAGEYWVIREPVSNLEQYLRPLIEEARQKTFGLTSRQLEILSAVVAGYSNKEIAECFKVSKDTLKRHLNNIYDKVGVSTRLDLVLFAVNQRLPLKSIA